MDGCCGQVGAFPISAKRKCRLQDTIDHEQIYDYSLVWIRKNQFAQGNLPLAHPNLPLNAKRVAVRHRFPIFELSG
jgi:hypothetical protein